MDNNLTYIGRKLNILFIFLFLLIFISATYRLTPFYGLVGHDDQGYKFDKPISSTWAQNVNNGEPWAWTMYELFPKDIFRIILKYFTFNEAWISYILWFAPILICFIIYQYLTFKVSKSAYLSFVIGILVIFTNISLQYFYFFPSIYYYALAVFGIHIFTSYFIWIKGSIKFKEVILLILPTLFLFHPFYLIIDLIYICSFLIYFRIVKKS